MCFTSHKEWLMVTINRIALLFAGRTSLFSIFSTFAQSSSVKLLNLEAAVVNNCSKFSENKDPVTLCNKACCTLQHEELLLF